VGVHPVPEIVHPVPQVVALVIALKYVTLVAVAAMTVPVQREMSLMVVQ
jgi:hypothetical protein